jgi:long-subunit fatty acid transport protein
VNSRAIALGNAYTAVADDFGATFYNVGGLAQIDKVILAFEFQITEDFLTAPDDPSNYYDIPNSHGFNIGAVVPFGSRVAFGFAMYLPAGYVSSLSMSNVYEPNYVFYDNTTNTVSILTGLSVEPVRGFSLGVGARSLGDLTSNVVSNTTFGESATDPYQPNIEMSTRVGQTISPVGGILLNFGAFHKAIEDLKLGMSYRHEIDISTTTQLDSTNTTAFTSGISLEQNYVLNLYSSLNFVPSELTLGLSYPIINKLMLSGDLTYARWSSFTSPGASVDVVSSSGGSFGEPVLTENPDAYFDDTISPKLGIEYRFDRIHGEAALDYLDIALRGGYAFIKSPVPSQDDTATNFLDSDKNIFSV